jgi:hypothetical protein
MFSPSMGHGPLGAAQTRKEAAVERGADAIHDLLEWQPPTKTPSAGFFQTRSKVEAGAKTTRVLFTGRFWMSEPPVAIWRGATHQEDATYAAKSVSSLVSRLIDAGAEPVKPVAKGLSELSLVPLDDAPDFEMAALQKVAGLELRVEVVRFQKPAPGATGISTGKVLAVSENYSAQQHGANQVVVHENRNLDRRLVPGEAVTLAYADGKAAVFDGIAHDINVNAPWMPRDQQAYLRMVMFDALSAMTTPQSDDDRLRDALRYALESTAKHFGASESKLRRADIHLVVNERQAVLKSLPQEDAQQAPPRTRRPGP